MVSLNSDRTVRSYHVCGAHLAGNLVIARGASHVQTHGDETVAKIYPPNICKRPELAPKEGQGGAHGLNDNSVSYSTFSFVQYFFNCIRDPVSHTVRSSSIVSAHAHQRV